MAVYRLRYAPLLAALLGAEQLVEHWDLRLWALDEPEPRLAEHTIGSGSGGKFELLDRLFKSRPVGSEDVVVCSDDDLIIERGSLSQLLELGRVAELDLFQPAHAWWSQVSWPYTCVRYLSRVRLTGFVEIGPLFCVSPSARASVLPVGKRIPNVESLCPWLAPRLSTWVLGSNCIGTIS